MARKKEKPIIDVDKLREIETYDHKDKKRSNNPTVGMAQYDTEEEKEKKYEFDPHLDPTLQWAGKAEGTSFTVPTSSIHIHESIKPHKIIKSVQTIGDTDVPMQMSLFETPVDRMKIRREAIEFYKHGKDWTNRMIAGDSLVIMNSMLEKEGMSGQVQMVYIDPPYGIKYGSNFQPFVNKRDVKDGKDDDLSQEPEMIKAFRDTWELGIHSYLTYLRNRLLLTRELLTDSGSVFVQISDENLHFVRNLCDEIFGAENFQALITFRKTSITFATEKLGGVCDYVIWYAKNNSKKKYNTLFIEKVIGGVGATNYGFVELQDGERRRLTAGEKANPSMIPRGSRVFSTENLVSSGTTDSCVYDFKFEGRTFKPLKGKSWKTNFTGMQRLIENNRILALGVV